MVGKSGYLPDISSKFNFFLAMAVNSLRQRNYNAAASGLDNMNALLTSKYVININNKLYKEKVQKESAFRCSNKNCTMIQTTVTLDENYEEQTTKETVRNEVPYSKVNVFTLPSSTLESILTKEKTFDVWICPKCKTQTRLKDTNIYEPTIIQPSFRRVVPECPIRKSGIATRFGFHEKFETWYYDYLVQLSHQLALYRIEYISINHEDMNESFNFQDTGDESKSQ